MPGGFGQRGTEGMILAIKRAREYNIPFLGICLGFQMAVVEWARNVCGLAGMWGSLKLVIAPNMFQTPIPQSLCPIPHTPL